MTLPRLRPLTMRHVLWFEVRHALPVAASVLYGVLGPWRASRAVAAYIARSAGRDPLRDAPAGMLPRHKEPQALRQFRSALLLDDVLTAQLGRAAAQPLVARVISETGARFVGTNVPIDTAGGWREANPSERERFATEATERFPNAVVERVSTGPDHMRFDVVHCRFAQLAVALGRPWLAPMFCAADALYFGRPGTPELRREETLAEGGERCTFEFSFAGE